jgi:Tfp pilus assembly protein FimV
VASTDQVESFSRADQKLAVGTQVEIPDRGKIAKVEATMEVSDHSDVDTEPFPEITTGKVEVAKSEYGGTVGRVQVNNPTNKSLKSARVGVICLDSKDRVVGGGSSYPELIPPSGRVLREVTVIASGQIERCDAYAGPGV